MNRRGFLKLVSTLGLTGLLAPLLPAAETSFWALCDDLLNHGYLQMDASGWVRLDSPEGAEFLDELLRVTRISMSATGVAQR